MPELGFHCSHEQYAPGELLRLAQLAGHAGFRHAMCSDHFHPWTPAQGHSGFAWSWLGAALATTPMSFGTVCAPGQRYHPAVIAQAAATLAEMHPDRLWVALGSGEAINEHITGGAWPPKETRQARLRACADVMRALWAGESVTCDGLVRVRDARLYSRPARAPLLVAAAISLETALWAGEWADGLITVTGAHDLRQTIAAFREGGGEEKPIFLQAVHAFAESDEEARRLAYEEWPQAALDAEHLEDLASPEDFARACRGLTVADAASRIRCSADPARHAAWIEEYFAAGVTRVYLHNVVRRHQERFIERLGRYAAS